MLYNYTHRIKDLSAIIVSVAFRTAKVVVSAAAAVVRVNESEVTTGCMSDWLPHILSLSYCGPEASQKEPLT